MGSTGQVTAGRGARALARAAAVAPFTGRERRELLFCLAGLPFGLVSPLVLFVLGVDMVGLVIGTGRANPSPGEITAAFAGFALLLVLLVATGAARGVGSLQRLLATRLLGPPIAAPPPVQRRPGELGRLGAGLRDGAGWRAMAYLLLKLPVALLELYAVFFWVGGLANLSYPFWWGAFRNHPSRARLSPVPVFTPFGWFGDGTFRVATLPGTFAAAAAGVAMLLAALVTHGAASSIATPAAPWVTRAIVS